MAENFKVQRQRIDLWDNLKFILIFFVVLGHMVDQIPDSDFFQSIYVFIYAFHMPLFFFISGMFHKNEGIVAKVCTFMALGYVYKFLLFALRSYLKEDVELRFFTESGTPWFMFALAAFILLSYLLRDMNQGFVLVITLLMSFFAGYDQTIGNQFSLSRIIYFYPFYVMGELVNKEKLMALARQKKLQCLGAAVLVLWFLVCIWYREQLYDMKEIFMGLKIKGEEAFEEQSLYRLCFYLITVLTSLACICVVPQGRIPWITNMGRRTLQIYFWHRPIIYIAVDLGLVSWICEYDWGRAVYLLLAIPFTLILSGGIFSFPTAQILWFGRNRSQVPDAQHPKWPDKIPLLERGQSMIDKILHIK